MKNSRPKGQKKKGKPATAGSRLSKSLYETKTSAPSAYGSVQQRIPQRFGAAAAHEDFPEGGLRMTVRARAPQGAVGADTTKSAAQGGFFDGTGQGCFLTVGMDTTSVLPTDSYNYQLFNSGIRTFASYFQRFRIRRLDIEYVSQCSTAQTGRVAIGYVKDCAMGMNATTSSTGNTFSAADYVDDLLRSKSFAAWEQNVVVPMIPFTKESRDDELFTPNMRSYVISNDGDLVMRSSVQGLVACANNLVTPSADTYLGSLYFSATIDLYGFNPAVSVIPTLGRTGEIPALLTERKTEYKTASKTVLATRDQDPGQAQDVEFGAILVKSQSQPALRTDVRQVGTQDGGRSWFGKPA
jgi:hypothetical protein